MHVTRIHSIQEDHLFDREFGQKTAADEAKLCNLHQALMSRLLKLFYKIAKRGSFRKRILKPNKRLYRYRFSHTKAYLIPQSIV